MAKKKHKIVTEDKAKEVIESKEESKTESKGDSLVWKPIFDDLIDKDYKEFKKTISGAAPVLIKGRTPDEEIKASDHDDIKDARVFTDAEVSWLSPESIRSVSGESTRIGELVSIDDYASCPVWEERWEDPIKLTLFNYIYLTRPLLNSYLGHNRFNDMVVYNLDCLNGLNMYESRLRYYDKRDYTKFASSFKYKDFSKEDDDKPVEDILDPNNIFVVNNNDIDSLLYKLDKIIFVIHSEAGFQKIIHYYGTIKNNPERQIQNQLSFCSLNEIFTNNYIDPSPAVRMDDFKTGHYFVIHFDINTSFIKPRLELRILELRNETALESYVNNVRESYKDMKIVKVG